jgi:hypothetical protein
MDTKVVFIGATDITDELKELIAQNCEYNRKTREDLALENMQLRAQLREVVEELEHQSVASAHYEYYLKQLETKTMQLQAEVKERGGKLFASHIAAALDRTLDSRHKYNEGILFPGRECICTSCQSVFGGPQEDKKEYPRGQRHRAPR